MSQRNYKQTREKNTGNGTEQKEYKYKFKGKKTGNIWGRRKIRKNEKLTRT